MEPTGLPKIKDNDDGTPNPSEEDAGGAGDLLTSAGEPVLAGETGSGSAASIGAGGAGPTKVEDIDDPEEDGGEAATTGAGAGGGGGEKSRGNGLGFSGLTQRVAKSGGEGGGAGK